MINTPLLLDFSNTIYPDTIPVKVPQSEAELLLLTKSVISSPEYFIKIFLPENISEHRLQKSYQFNIPSHPLLNYKLRISLPPSVGYGTNSCYRVEYWQYQKPYKKGKTLDSTRIITKQLSEEYWRIPTIDKSYIITLLDLKLYKPNYKFTNNFTFTKNGVYQTLTNNLDIISINSIISNSISYSNFKIIDDSTKWKPYFTPIIPEDNPPPSLPTVKLEWLDGTVPTEGSDYIINYVIPLGLSDIVYIDLHNQSILDIPLNNYFYNSSFNNLY